MGLQCSYSLKPQSCLIHRNAPEFTEIIYPFDEVEHTVDDLSKTAHSHYRESCQKCNYDYSSDGIMKRMYRKKRRNNKSVEYTENINQSPRPIKFPSSKINPSNYLRSSMLSIKNLVAQKKYHSFKHNDNYTLSLNGEHEKCDENDCEFGNLPQLLNVTEVNEISFNLDEEYNMDSTTAGYEENKLRTTSHHEYKYNDKRRLQRISPYTQKLLRTETKMIQVATANSSGSPLAGEGMGGESDHLSVNTDNYGERKTWQSIRSNQEIMTTEILTEDYLHSGGNIGQRHLSYTASKHPDPVIFDSAVPIDGETATSLDESQKLKSFRFVQKTQQANHLPKRLPPNQRNEDVYHHSEKQIISAALFMQDNCPQYSPDSGSIPHQEKQILGYFKNLRKLKDVPSDSASTLTTEHIGSYAFTRRLLDRQNQIKAEWRTVDISCKECNLRKSKYLETTTSADTKEAIKDWRSDSRFKIDHLFNNELSSLASLSEPTFSLTAYSPKWIKRFSSNLKLFRIQPDTTNIIGFQINRLPEDYCKIELCNAGIIPECLNLLETRHFLLQKNRNRLFPSSPSSRFPGGNVTNRVTKATNIRRICKTAGGRLESKVAVNKDFLISQSINIYSYCFWIRLEPWIESLFENHDDRRIESIGRVSDCRICLTKRVRRNPIGFIEIMVNILAPSASALQKCCKLFDDKFPKFYASAGLLLEHDQLSNLSNFHSFMPTYERNLIKGPPNGHINESKNSSVYKNSCSTLCSNHKLCYSTTCSRNYEGKRTGNSTSQILSRHCRQYYFKCREVINSNANNQTIKFLPLPHPESLDNFTQERISNMW